MKESKYLTPENIQLRIAAILIIMAMCCTCLAIPGYIAATHDFNTTQKHFGTELTISSQKYELRLWTHELTDEAGHGILYGPCDPSTNTRSSLNHFDITLDPPFTVDKPGHGGLTNCNPQATP